MTISSLRRGLHWCALAVTLTLLSPWCLGAPGAHGPNGEHLDAPANAGPQSAASRPRFETKTELFELVGTLAGGELSLLIDRFETNEPLLDAQVEVESGGLKAKARFHADHGDYAVDDEAMLKLLAKPATHALVITVLAGKESDLLDAKLVVAGDHPDDESSHGHAHADGADALPGHVHGLSTRTKWIGTGVLVTLTLLSLYLLRRRGSAWGGQGGERS